jgi:hypothetical protein
MAVPIERHCPWVKRVPKIALPGETDAMWRFEGRLTGSASRVRPHAGTSAGPQASVMVTTSITVTINPN